jgi:hypothetical protein
MENNFQKSMVDYSSSDSASEWKKLVMKRCVLSIFQEEKKRLNL